MAIYKQCKKCPWRKDVDPRTIPGGYDEAKHRALTSTIAEPGSMRATRRMACHETPVGAERECAGWLTHQLGPGNNIGLRLWAMGHVENIQLVGEQHESLEATFPPSRGRAG